MEKSKEELLSYSIKILQRGDGYRAVMSYLERYTSDEKIISEIMKSLRTQEKHTEVERCQASEKEKSPERILLGIFLLLLGSFLTFFLWNQGFITKLPIALILIGMGVFSKGMRFI